MTTGTAEISFAEKLKPKSLGTLDRIAQRALAYCTHMIWEANHRSDVEDGDPKVGGHPASCSSSLHLALQLDRQAAYQEVFADLDAAELKAKMLLHRHALIQKYQANVGKD